MNNSKLKETKKRGIKTLIALLVIAVSVYLGFTPLYALIPEGVPKAVIGSSFGAIFVIILTMYLLNKQTEIEQESKRGERVFDEKVKLYQLILKTIRLIAEDGIISTTEVKQLSFAMLNLQMVGADDTVQSFSNVLKHINAVFSENDDDEVEIGQAQEKELFSLVSKFSIQCRIDLGISETGISEELISAVLTVVDDTNNLSKRKRDTSKILFKGVSYKKSHLVHAIFKDFILKNPEINFEELVQKFPAQGKKSKRMHFVKLEEALEIKERTGTARHFIKEDQVLTLKDGAIAVSNQWGIINLPPFLEHCRENLGIEVG